MGGCCRHDNAHGLGGGGSNARGTLVLRINALHGGPRCDHFEHIIGPCRELDNANANANANPNTDAGPNSVQ